MSQVSRIKTKGSGAHRLISLILFILAGILVATSLFTFIVRGMDNTEVRLGDMRTSAVLHAASGGLVDSIAAEAKAAKLKELRARSDFRQMGGDEVNALCAQAEADARAEAEALYANTDNANAETLVPYIDALAVALSAVEEALDDEMNTYAGIYTAIYEGVADWTDFTAGLDDDMLVNAMTGIAPELANAPQLHSGLIKMARSFSSKEQTTEYNALRIQLCAAMVAAVPDWTEMSAEAAQDDATLWAALTQRVPELTEAEDFRDDLVKEARTNIQKAEKGETVTAAQVDEGAATENLFTVDYAYFAESETLESHNGVSNEAYSALFAELVNVIPDLDTLNKKMKNNIQADIETVVGADNDAFSSRYAAYAAQKADRLLTGSSAFMIRLAAVAEQILIAGIALLLFALLYAFWKPVSKRLGVPRAIITLFFIYLCLAAELYNINVPFMLGNVLERVGMYGILVLAMLPGIQCGIGLNMGMTIGCISGLFGIVLALQYNMTGYAAMIFACVIGAIVAIPLGWAYAKLLNRMKGNEMTISTYVGFSFVSLMCIGWMLLPFNNPRIIWLLSGSGLRVTHSLLGSFAHLLDDLMAFDLFGADIPTGLLLFFLLCCGIMWLFSRSKTGIAMTAVGSNPRFAEASGINVNHMRTVGTVLSTVLAAIGIVIYSQAFGYAQLYTAPRQLGFIAASAILIGGATVSKAKVGHVIIGVFLFEGVLAMGQQIANAAVAGGGLSEVMRIMISNGIILYALTQSGGASRG